MYITQTRKILITGGAGFIGSNFVHYLLEKYKNIHIIVIDKLTYAGNLKNLKKWESDPRLKFYKVDIANKDALFSTCLNLEFTEIAHFAAESHVDRSILGPEEFIQTNIVGTFHLLELVREKQKRHSFHKFLHVSTDEVYGSLGQEGFFTESTPYSPNSPYSASKAGSDLLVRAYYHTYNLPVVTTNCSNNYGPYQFPEKLIPLMILNCLQNKPLPIYGKGENIRDWLYVKDHCSALDLVLEKGKLGETYNIGTRNERKNIEIVQLICKLMDQKNPFHSPHSKLIQFVKDRPGHDFRYAIDPTKIEIELGWKASSNFEKALEDTIDWYINNEEWWKEILSGEYKNYYKAQYIERVSA